MSKQHPIRDQRGQSVAEFALVLPLLMLILLAILQFGVLFRDYLAVTDAVRAGARKAAVSRSAAFPTTACEDAVARMEEEMMRELSADDQARLLEALKTCVRSLRAGFPSS